MQAAGPHLECRASLQTLLILEVCYSLCCLKCVLGTLIYYLSFFYCIFMINDLNFIISLFLIPKSFQGRKEKSSSFWGAWFPKNCDTFFFTNSCTLRQGKSRDTGATEAVVSPMRSSKRQMQRAGIDQGHPEECDLAEQKSLSRPCIIQLSRASLWG